MNMKNTGLTILMSLHVKSKIKIAIKPKRVEDIRAKVLELNIENTELTVSN